MRRKNVYAPNHEKAVPRLIRPPAISLGIVP